MAFTDDDCQPDADWLRNAQKHLTGTDLCGLEGYVYTDEEKIHDPNYRIVTNKGFEGIGFITANLIIKTDILRKIGGFDVRFDKPHFREDTDLGWRAQEVRAHSLCTGCPGVPPASPEEPQGGVCCGPGLFLHQRRDIVLEISGKIHPADEGRKPL